MPFMSARGGAPFFRVFVVITALISHTALFEVATARSSQQSQQALPWAPTPKVSQFPPARDIGWPPQVKNANGTLIYYQPQTAGRSVYGPYGAVRTSVWSNPATGVYGLSANVQGWYGGRTVASGYNPWTGAYGATRQGHNAYSQWGSSVATRGGQWVQTVPVTTAAGTTADYRTSGGQSGVVRSGANGTVARGTNWTYVGHDGNVHRKDSSGSWSQCNKGNWNQVDTSAARANPQQNLQNRLNSNLSGATQNRSYQNRANVDSSTMQGLDRSAASRQRGQY
jgi:hypothetical protein